MKKSITIHEIAELAKVSPATVSRVLSNSDYPVSKELQDRIRRIAKEVNYIPNMLGKQLKKNTSTTIAVIIPSISNPFYSSVVFGIEEVAREHNYTVITCNSLQDPALEEEYIRTIMEKQIKGLIISSISEDKTLLRQCMKLGLNVVAIDQFIEEDQVSQIKFDYQKGGYLATKHLLDLGHTRIAYLTSKLDRPSRKSIYQGYVSAMKESGFTPMMQESGSEDLYNPVHDFDTGKRLAGKLFRELKHGELPTALFACNDMMAFGVIHELTERGVKVPHDISVVGFDGIDFGMMIQPPLTSIKQPDYEMGKMACKLLFDKIQGEDLPAYDVVLQPKLITRGSTTQISLT